MGEEPGISRRQMLAGAAGLAGVAAVAGCVTGEETAEFAGSVEDAAQEQPPTAPSNPNQSEYAQYVIESLAYQNRQQQAQSRGIVALLRDAGVEPDDDEGGE